LRDPNYGAHFLRKGEPIPENVPGFSAGKFAIKGKNLALHVFSCIQEEVKANPNTNYYCIDQPIFNYTIVKYCSANFVNTQLFGGQTVSTNFGGFDDEKTALMDFMGEPGNEQLHMGKLVGTISLLYAGLNL
jgi:hypothetical protein